MAELKRKLARVNKERRFLRETATLFVRGRPKALGDSELS